MERKQTGPRACRNCSWLPQRGTTCFLMPAYCWWLPHCATTTASRRAPCWKAWLRSFPGTTSTPKSWRSWKGRCIDLRNAAQHEPPKESCSSSRETLLKHDTTNARSPSASSGQALDSAELPKKRRVCFARDDRDELNQSFRKCAKTIHGSRPSVAGADILDPQRLGAGDHLST